LLAIANKGISRDRAAAGHELKGLINFYKVHHFGICVPLMTIIGTCSVSRVRKQAHVPIWCIVPLYMHRLPRLPTRGTGLAAHRR
jgi:hypothetical protein